jgi:cytochrome c oxidase cbb3-type subunit 2
MNPGPLLFLATFFTLAMSWFGFVLAPQLQLGNQQRVESKTTGDLYPQMRPGMARQGEQVYRANGCNACHTQQVRPKGYGGDYARGWGARDAMVQSVNEDYLYDHPAMLGTQRVGPDLANIGLRQTNATMLLVHLYNPQFVMPKSVMPPYRYLFEKHKLEVGKQPSAEALPLDAAGTPGYEVVPTDAARQLAAYLLSLHSDQLLFETPPLKTNAPSVKPAQPAATTNAPGTNTPAK